MKLPDIVELRELARHMTPDERDGLHRLMFGGDYEPDVLACFELERLSYLGKKLTKAWPYCGGDFWDVSLLEMLAALNDEEMRDFLSLSRWVRGDERPAEYRDIMGPNWGMVSLANHYRPELGYQPHQPLSEALRIFRATP